MWKIDWIFVVELFGIYIGNEIDMEMKIDNI